MARTAEKRGFGSIRRLTSGNYQVRFTAPSGEVILAPTTFRARIDAEAWLIAERRLLEDVETWRPPDVRLEMARLEAEAQRLPRFQDYAEQWIETRRSSRGEPLRPLTRDKYRTSLRTHIYPTFGAVPLDKITRLSVRTWFERLQTGPSARAAAHTTLRTILNSAVDEDELLERNPARIRGAGAQMTRKNLRTANLQELETMVQAMPERHRLLLLLATWCALRSGELRELRRSDIEVRPDRSGEPTTWVNVSRGVVHARTIDPVTGSRTAPTVGPPKTDAGIRSVSLPDFLAPVVQDHLARHAAPGPNGLLFYAARDPSRQLSESSHNGRPAVFGSDGSTRHAGFGWREARRVAGRADLDLHDLRHTGASWAGEEGASLAELMHRLGHSTPGMAMRYQHSRLERDREIGRRLSARGTLQTG